MAESIIRIPIQGMDCTECTLHVKDAIAGLPGVESVDVFLASEKAVIQLDPDQVDLPAIRKAVENAGYSAPLPEGGQPKSNFHQDFRRPILIFLGIVFGAVLFVVVAGEWLGLFEALTARVPSVIGLVVVLLAGYPVFLNVVSAALNKRVIAHTLMSVGVLAALAVGEWATAAVIVFFMRMGDYAEHFTAERARRAVKDLTTLAPQTARVERGGLETEVPIEEVQLGEMVLVRPGEKIPVDGDVTGGRASVDQATITGESIPVEVGPGARVYAATIISRGSLRVRTTHIGSDTTFGRVIKLVEEAEAHRAEVQSVADRFSGYYFPVVAGIAALTYLLRRDPMATAAVLVVACSCSFALATPIAMLASIGAGAKRGLLIKGGKYLELLAQADVLLIDKTGTLTLGKPHITDVVFQDMGLWKSVSPLQTGIQGPQSEILQLAASAERYSEHPLAEAVRTSARAHKLILDEPQQFETIPGQGMRAVVKGNKVTIGNRRMIAPLVGSGLADGALAIADELEAQGKTLLFIANGDSLAGVLAASDVLRPEVPQAIDALRTLGFRQVEILTGDNQPTAAALAGRIGVDYQAELLPEEKIDIVKAYQSQGHTVVMVGDGVNDAPALAQADVGIAMGAAGSDVAIEAAHIALMRDDWTLIPQVVRIARRTMRVVKTNIAFTAVYNLVGLTLASLGFLPPIFAAAAQSLPDLGILGNSSRLLRQ